MSLRDTFVKAVATIDKIITPLKADVTHRRYTGEDLLGDATYSDAAITAFVETKIHQRRLSDGRVVRIETVLTITEQLTAQGDADRENEPIDWRDLFILPGGEEGHVLDIEGPMDPQTGTPYATTVYLGPSSSGTS